MKKHKIIKTEEEYFKLLDLDSELENLIGIDPYVDQRANLLEYASKELQNNKEFLLNVIRRVPRTYKKLSQELKNDPDIVKAVIFSETPEILYVQEFDCILTDDFEEAMKILDKRGEMFIHLSDELKNDRRVVEKAIEKFPIQITYDDVIPKKFIDKNLALIAIRKANIFEMDIYRELPENIKNDREAVLAAINNGCLNIGLNDLSKELRDDEEIVLKFLERSQTKSDFFKRNKNVDYLFISDRLKNDINFARKAIKLDSNIIQALNDNFITDPIIMEETFKSLRNDVGALTNELLEIIKDLSQTITNNKYSSKEDLVKAESTLNWVNKMQENHTRKRK